MFDVKVKTLDGRNQSFTVEDEITVAEFKEKISEAVNIPASSQRLIFTGKVLTNSNKLKTYNVADKVIHVVNSKPPSAAPTAASGAASNASSSTAAPMGASSGPTVSMSSVPSNMIGEMMNNVMAGLPPGDAMVHHMDLRRSMAGPPQHTESGRRVVLIRQWIRDAHSLIDRIGNPSQGTRLTADSQTLEARNASQSVHHMPGGSVSVTTTTGPRPNTSGPRPGAPIRPAAPVRAPLVNQTPRPATSRSSTSSSDANTPTPAIPPVNPNVEVLSSLWGEVDALNSRLRVHNHRFRDLLHSPMAGCPGHNQHLFDTHNAVTHCLAHIYHALSDLQCDFSSEVHRELTAVEAPAPPPTAIIQQTIPVTIPLRATVNVAPNAARRPTSVTNTSTTNSATSDSRAAQTTAGQQGVYTSIELDMETDSGEDITDDAQRSETRTPSAPVPPVAGGPGGFNLSQLIQDAFSGITGGLTDGLHQGTSQASTTTASTRPTATSAASIPPGAFGSFIPPPGSATPANGPTEQQPQVPGLPPGFPFPQATPSTPKDRQDPYLTSCSSRHWLPSRSTSQSNSTRSSSRPPALPPRTAATRTSTTASRSPYAGSTSTQRHTTPRVSNSNPSDRGSASEASSSAASISSTRADEESSEERRQFYEGIRDSLVSMAVEQPWLSTGESRVPVPAVQRLNERVRSVFNEVAMGRSSNLTIADLSRMSLESLPSASSQSDLGVLGELCILLFREITLPDLYRVFMGHGQHLDRLREPLRRFVRFNVLQDGQPTQDNIMAAARRLAHSSRRHINDTLRLVEVRRGRRPRQQYDAAETLLCWVQAWLFDMFVFLINSKASASNYGQQLLDRLHRGVREGLRLCYTLFDSMSNLTESAAWTLDFVDEVIGRSIASNRMLGDVLRSFTRSHLSNPSLQQSINSMEIGVLEEVLVPLTEQPMATDSPRTNSPLSGDSDYHDSEEFAEAPATTQVGQVVGLTTSIPTQTTPTPSSPLDTSSLSEASAADWRAVIPADWVAIIEEDIKRQLRLESSSVDQPLSEAYLNGRPQKRRRLSEEEDEQ